MGWKHIVFEAYCMFVDEKNNIPSCCSFGPNKLGSHCLKFDEDNNSMCPFLGIGTAKSSLVLTDDKGLAINGTCFFGDLKQSDESWKKSERDWIIKQIKYIDQENKS